MERVIEERKVTYTEKIKADFCDKCDKNIEEDHFGKFDHFKSRYEAERGECYPEGCFGNIVSMDLCYNCSEKFEQLLRDNGYRLNEESL